MSKPFVKWVGGKTQLLDTLLALFPAKVRTYYEPFLGGGAVFFRLAEETRFERATINDANNQLIAAYRIVQSFPDALLTQLREREAQYAVDPERVYREWVQEMPEDPLRVAARLIALNKTSFNGLYRTNRAGRFNVPWGKKPTVRLVSGEVLQACHDALAGYVRLRSGDYEASLQGAGLGDLIYMDPPYVPLGLTGFTGYTPDAWPLEAHQRVSEVARHYADLGCTVVVSNHDTPLVREIYHDFTATVVKVRRAINRDGSKRGPIGEVILTRNLASIE